MVSTSDHPDKAYLGTAETDSKKRYQFFQNWDTNE